MYKYCLIALISIVTQPGILFTDRRVSTRYVIEVLLIIIIITSEKWVEIHVFLLYVSSPGMPPPGMIPPGFFPGLVRPGMQQQPPPVDAGVVPKPASKGDEADKEKPKDESNKNDESSKDDVTDKGTVYSLLYVYLSLKLMLYLGKLRTCMKCCSNCMRVHLTCLHPA